jgi:hypothetical protein
MVIQNAPRAAAGHIAKAAMADRRVLRSKFEGIAPF